MCRYLAGEVIVIRYQHIAGCQSLYLYILTPEAGQWAVEGRPTGAGAGTGAAVQRTRKDRVAQLALLDDDRAHARPWSAFCCKLLS